MNVREESRQEKQKRGRWTEKEKEEQTDRCRGRDRTKGFSLEYFKVQWKDTPWELHAISSTVNCPWPCQLSTLNWREMALLKLAGGFNGLSFQAI